MAPDARVAVYYAPRPDDPLFVAASAWLGRDAESGAPLPQPDLPDLPDIAALTAEPRGYGFHATLKPPMRLAEGRNWDALLQAARDLAERTAAFALPPLAVSDVHGFLALRETQPCPPLQALADACVTTLDPFRAQPSAADLARRRRGGLTPRQDAMLVRWGYPYVFDTWFFHMTLTRRLTAVEKSLVQPAAERHLAPALRLSRRVEDICLFTQSAPGADFVLAERLPLPG
jgi:putative phosphonate metabolism protein